MPSNAESESIAATITMMLQSGRMAKLKDTIVIQFPNPFTARPNVVVSQEFSKRLENPETIVAVTLTDFTIDSVHSDTNGNYYVNWMAFGPIA